MIAGLSRLLHKLPANTVNVTCVKQVSDITAPARSICSGTQQEQSNVSFIRVLYQSIVSSNTLKWAGFNLMFLTVYCILWAFTTQHFVPSVLVLLLLGAIPYGSTCIVESDLLQASHGHLLFAK